SRRNSSASPHPSATRAAASAGGPDPNACRVANLIRSVPAEELGPPNVDPRGSYGSHRYHPLARAAWASWAYHTARTSTRPSAVPSSAASMAGARPTRGLRRTGGLRQSAPALADPINQEHAEPPEAFDPAAKNGALARAAAEVGTWLFPLLVCVVRAGLRIGEVLALRPEDLDLTTAGRAVTNLVNAGVPAHEAMAVSGHQTRSVFDRYSLTLKAQPRAAPA